MHRRHGMFPVAPHEPGASWSITTRKLRFNYESPRTANVLATSLLSLLVLAPLIGEPLVTTQQDLQRYWLQNSTGRMSARQSEASKQWHQAISDRGPVYVTYRFVVEIDGSIADLEVVEIDPPVADAETAEQALSIGRYTPAPGVDPVRVRVELTRVKNWVPKERAATSSDGP
jgi:hypothetical protein